MFFTQEDYRKIEKWLLANSRKDTDFVGAATPLKGNETVVLVQNSKNVRVSLKDLINQIFLLGVSDFLNVTDKFNAPLITIEQAIQLIPFKSRKLGQVITFLNEDNVWGIYQFQGDSINQWNNPTLWIQVIGNSNIEVVPDNEDITGTKVGNRLILSFANKKYEPNKFSGLGRVYLRKNVVNVEDPVTGNMVTMNYLQQSMITKENTIYIVQYSYDLNKQTISIPEGSILLFEGGDINNGTINCNSTIIVGKFGGNATIAGTYSFQDAQADEEDITQSQSSILKFKDKGYDEANFSGLGRTYLRKNIVNGVNVLSQDMINNPNTIYHIQYDYNLNNQTIIIPSGCVLLFEGGSINNGKLTGNNTKLAGDIKILQCVGSGTYDIDKVNVRNFGAKGDGISNDTQAFNNALSFIIKKTNYTQSPNSVLTLYIPNGIYRIEEVTVTNCSIIGESSTGTIIQGVDLSTSNITFIHSQTATYGPKTIISNLYFSNGTFSNRKTSVEFNNCFFGAGGISILQTSDVFIKSCIFDQTSDCIKVEQSTNISISNNIFFDNALRAIWVVSGQNIIISNNNFNSCWGRPILIQSGSQINIVGNNFRSKDGDINDQTPAFVKLQYTTSPTYDYSFDGISISNNIFECEGKYNAIYINSAKTVSNLVIKDNEIHEAIKGVESIQGTQRLVITGNVFSGSLYHNIWTNTSNVCISNNILIDGGELLNNDVFQSSIMTQATGAIIINNVQKYTKSSKFKYWLCLNGSANPANYSVVLDNMLQKYSNELYIKDVLAETDYSYMYSNRENMINHIYSLAAIGSVTPFKDMKLYVGDSAPLYFNNGGWMNEDGTLLSKVIII